jgi:hypothetical protein
MMSELQLASSDWLTVLGLGIALAVFAWNGRNRAEWSARWTAKSLGSIPIPERRWTYDAHDLEDFADAAKRAGMLDDYIAILRGSDLCFAISLSAVTAFIWYQVALSPMPFAVLNWAALPLGAMAILYGIADVAEDLKLATILRHPKSIDQADAAATNTLTRLKRATLMLSVVGALIFLVLAAIEDAASRLLDRGNKGTGLPA